MLACTVDHVVPPSVDLSSSYPVMAEPPLLDGAVQDKLICDDEVVVAVRPVGDPGTVAVPVPDGFTSIAASSQESPPAFAVQLQVTDPADACDVELDAPVIAFAMLISHCCVHVGEPSVWPPYIDGKSRTQLFGFFVVIDMVGLLADVAEL